MTHKEDTSSITPKSITYRNSGEFKNYLHFYDQGQVPLQPEDQYQLQDPDHSHHGQLEHPTEKSDFTIGNIRISRLAKTPPLYHDWIRLLN